MHILVTVPSRQDTALLNSSEHAPQSQSSATLLFWQNLKGLILSSAFCQRLHPHSYQYSSDSDLKASNFQPIKFRADSNSTHLLLRRGLGEELNRRGILSFLIKMSCCQELKMCKKGETRTSMPTLLKTTFTSCFRTVLFYNNCFKYYVFLHPPPFPICRLLTEL